MKISITVTMPKEFYTPKTEELLAQIALEHDCNLDVVDCAGNRIMLIGGTL